MVIHPIRYVLTLAVMGVLLLSGCYGPAQTVVSTVPPERGFALGPEDIVDVVVFRNEDLTRTGLVIRPDGKISLPLIGDVQASGRTAEELSEDITERYREYKENPAVSVSVTAVNSYNIFVLGEVQQPGKLQLKSYATILQGIVLAGGFTEFASKNGIQVVRNTVDENGNPQEIRIPVQYDSLLSEEGAKYNFILHPGDTIVVP